MILCEIVTKNLIGILNESETENKGTLVGGAYLHSGLTDTFHALTLARVFFALSYQCVSARATCS